MDRSDHAVVRIVSFVGRVGVAITALLLLTGGPLLAVQEQGEEELSADPWLENPEKLEEALERWADEYVLYLITDEEREIYESLPTAEQKIAFIERFWKLRDPTPGTPENEYREQHLKRFAFATRTFAAGLPGWKTDRGRIYIVLGPPNQIQRNPTGRGPLERASETWTYNGVDNPQLPASFDVSFVDFHGTGEYEMVSDLDATAPLWTQQFGFVHSNLDAFAVRRHARSLYDEQLGVERPVHPTEIAQDYLEFFRRVREIEEVPEIHLERLASLRESVDADVSFGGGTVTNQIAFFSGEATDTAVQVTLALSYDRLDATRLTEGRHFSADIYAALRSDGETVAEAERRLNFQLAPEEWERLNDKLILQRLDLAAPPGTYELVMLTRDNVGRRVDRSVRRVRVPNLKRPGLRLSSLTLASHVQRVGRDRDASKEPFLHGDLVVVPNVDSTFRPDERLLMYVQGYGLELDAGGKNRVTLKGRILKDGEPYRGIPAQHPYPAPRQRMAFTLGVSLASIPTGEYTATVTVVDEVAGTEATVSTPFRITTESRRSRRAREDR